MKKIVSIALFSLICSISFAQSNPKTTSIVKEDTFIANKTKGVYNFQMPEGTSADKVKETANYYINYFTVNYDSKTRIANITMVQEKMAGVIFRFLLSNEIETILYDGKEYKAEKFVGDFVQ